MTLLMTPRVTLKETAFYCGKIEYRLSCRMDDPAFPHPKTVGARSGASTAPGKSASKKALLGFSS
jgi:hypothetical protein